MLENLKKKILDNKIGIDFSFYDDPFLLRFLRARKFDLELTFKMFSSFLTWRREYGTDEIEVILNLKRILTFLKFFWLNSIILMDTIKQTNVEDQFILKLLEILISKNYSILPMKKE